MNRVKESFTVYSYDLQSLKLEKQTEDKRMAWNYLSFIPLIYAGEKLENKGNKERESQGLSIAYSFSSQDRKLEKINEK